ncbi:hypothetical protein VPHK394_0062 [Vibrio phage K394]
MFILRNGHLHLSDGSDSKSIIFVLLFLLIYQPIYTQSTPKYTVGVSLMMQIYLIFSHHQDNVFTGLGGTQLLKLHACNQNYTANYTA